MARFPATQWSLVRGSGVDAVDRREAFAELARRYQPAIRAYLRARMAPADVDDAMQAFLADSYEHAWFARANPAFGSFRGFLLLMLRRHVQRWHRRLGADPVVMADALDEPVDDAGPERAFDSRFLLALTADAIERLRASYGERGRSELFAALLPTLLSPPRRGELAALGNRLGVPANTLAVEIRRLRKRLTGALRQTLVGLCIDEETAARDWEALRLSSKPPGS